MERAKLNCPVTDYHKRYKVRGWLNKHLQSCHPDTASGKREQSSRATTPLPPAGGGKLIPKDKLEASTEMLHPISTFFP
ncbi:hypothetical protein ACTXT7_005457 [Hymenolepis weldensis]